MHPVAKEIQTVIKKAHLTVSDVNNLPNKITTSLDDVEGQVIALLAPLSAKERDMVLMDLAETIENHEMRNETKRVCQMRRRL